MSRKVPEVIFSATASGGNLIFENSMHLSMYCKEHEGETLFIHIQPDKQLSKKLQMYKYYHKVVLECAVIGYTSAGYPGMDTVKADYLLLAELAKDFIEMPDGKYQPRVMDKRDMTNSRLHKFISDAIFFIENEFDIEVPDSESYKISVGTGRDFKAIN